MDGAAGNGVMLLRSRGRWTKRHTPAGDMEMSLLEGRLARRAA